MKGKTLAVRIKKTLSWLISNIRTDKVLFVNFASLGLVQFTNFALPLLMYPYLFRIVGTSYFGAVAYALNIAIYLSAFIDYGFNLSAPRTVALVRSSSIELSATISKVLQTKFYFFLLCCLGLGLGTIFLPRLQNDIWLYAYGLLYLAGSCVLPMWLFQGLEDMHHLTWINLIAKTGSTLLAFIIVRQPSDYQYIVGLFGLANLVSGVIGIIYARRRYGLSLRWQPLSVIINEIRVGWYHFLSSFSSVVSSNSTVVILGIFVTNDILGKYSIAEKIAFAIWQLVSIFSQATYPTLCRLAAESHKEVLKFIYKYHLPFLVLIGIICICLAVSAGWIVEIATGANQPSITTLLRILAIFPFIVCLNVPVYQVLLIYQKQKYNALIFNVSIILSISFCAIMSATYGAVGAAWASVCTQIAVTLSLHLVLVRKFPEYAL